MSAFARARRAPHDVSTDVTAPRTPRAPRPVLRKLRERVCACRPLAVPPQRRLAVRRRASLGAGVRRMLVFLCLERAVLGLGPGPALRVCDRERCCRAGWWGGEPEPEGRVWGGLADTHMLWGCPFPGD